MGGDSDTDDDIPLTQYFSKSNKAIAIEDSEDDLPDWVKDYKSPSGPPARKDPSDSDESCPGSNAEPKPTENKVPDPVPASTDEQHAKVAAHVKPIPASTKTGADTKHKLHPSAAAKPVAGTSNVGAETAALPASAKPPAVAPVANIPGEVSLMLPEKLHRNKILIEVASTDDNPATDLAGDAGAVGRVIVMGAGKSGTDEAELHLDLKGVLYKAEILPLAGCAMVVNIGATDAKVESLVADYVRLRPESAYELMGSEIEGIDMMMDDDEDNYQLDEEGDNGDGDSKKSKKKGAGQAKEKGTAKPKAARKPAAAKKPAAKKKPGTARKSAGVTKKAGKAK